MIRRESFRNVFTISDLQKVTINTHSKVKSLYVFVNALMYSPPLYCDFYHDLIPRNSAFFDILEELLGI
jgi:hypothetical protein